MLKPKVLFLRGTNACRTQMAEGFLRDLARPIFPGVVWRHTWPLEDPQAVASPQERKAAMRRTRDDIQRRVIEFVSENS